MPYQNLKTQITEVSKSLKQNSDDKPMINMGLNDFFDSLCKNDIEQLVLREKISEKKAEQYKNWLINYVCKLHV